MNSLIDEIGDDQANLSDFAIQRVSRMLLFFFSKGSGRNSFFSFLMFLQNWDWECAFVLNDSTSGIRQYMPLMSQKSPKIVLGDSIEVRSFFLLLDISWLNKQERATTIHTYVGNFSELSELRYHNLGMVSCEVLSYLSKCCKGCISPTGGCTFCNKRTFFFSF